MKTKIYAIAIIAMLCTCSSLFAQTDIDNGKPYSVTTFFEVLAQRTSKVRFDDSPNHNM